MLPDFGAGDVQLQVHQVSVSGLIELAVDRDRSQERVLRIEGPVRTDGHHEVSTRVRAKTDPRHL